MKLDLFENKYRPSNMMKIFFVDIVCFLLVSAISLGMCYAYLSDSVSVKGSVNTAFVDVEYQYDLGEGYTSVSDIYVKLNNENQVTTLSEIKDILTPGDTITIVGRALNTSNIAVYVLAKLEIEHIKGGVEGKEVVWINIGDNNPQYNPTTGDLLTEETKEALDKDSYKQLTTADMVDEQGKTHKVYQVGAGIIAGSVKKGESTYYHYKELAIPYKFSGDEYVNGDKITKITFTLTVHQKNYLRSDKTDFVLYSQFEDANKKINNYDTESIYAAHYMTGNLLTEN